jgi:hypothetical protein
VTTLIGITAPPESVWEEIVERVRQTRPSLLAEYMDSYGLSVLPVPHWVDVENATVFHKMAGGGIDSFRTRLADPSGGALVALMERRLLLAPLEEVTPLSAVETVVETETATPERTGQAESSTNEKPFKCNLKWTNGKSCRRAYKRQGDLGNHKKKHYGVTV